MESWKMIGIVAKSYLEFPNQSVYGTAAGAQCGYLYRDSVADDLTGIV